MSDITKALITVKAEGSVTSSSALTETSKDISVTSQVKADSTATGIENNVDTIFTNTYTLGTEVEQLLDLSAIVDEDGNTINFGRIRAIVLKVPGLTAADGESSNATFLLFGAATNGFAGFVETATDAIRAWYGGVVVLENTVAGGGGAFDVSPTSNILRLKNESTVDAGYCELVIYGNAA